MRSVVVLPAPFGTEEAGDRTGFDREAQPVDCADLAAEHLRQVVDDDPSVEGRLCHANSAATALANRSMLAGSYAASAKFPITYVRW